MTSDAIVDRAREAFSRSAWAEAYTLWTQADREQPLTADDLVGWATATYLLGHDAEADDFWARAHKECLEHGDSARAARCAFWLGLGLFLRGETAQGGAWIARAHQAIGGVPNRTAEHGYLLVPAGLQTLASGDAAAAQALFSEAAELGGQFDDGDLLTLARLGQGQALVREGQISRGLAFLDEAMVAIIAGDVGAVVAGIVFCAVIEACHDAFDVRRAQEWTEAMTRWCATQPDLVPYRGQCSIYRARVLRLHGQWEEALREALLACERLGTPPTHPAVGMAHYELGELRRLQGDLEAAESAYREANRSGHSPQPGLGLLNLSRGRLDTARAALLQALDEVTEPLGRAPLLVAVIEADLADDDASSARARVTELSRIAAESDAIALHGAAGYADGAVQLAEGDARAAALGLRETVQLWRGLGAPYEEARTLVVRAQACRRLGDTGTADLDLDAACFIFARIGAAADLSVALALVENGEPLGAADGLSPREVQVLQLVATGQTNREIAGRLTLSEHTVRRHLQNIFAKLDVPSRAAATAYAYRHQLL